MRGSAADLSVLWDGQIAPVSGKGLKDERRTERTSSPSSGVRERAGMRPCS